MSRAELQLDRLIAASPERLFAFWTDPALLLKWWGPEGYVVTSSAFDVRDGGAWRTQFLRPDGVRRTVIGVYRLIDPPRRLVFTWAWIGEHGQPERETEVSVQFDAIAGGTRLTLRQADFAGVDDRDRHEAGWSSSLLRLQHAAI